LTLPEQINKDKKYVYALICFGCLTISFNVAAIAAAVPVISVDLGLSDLLVAKIIPYYLIPYGLGALIYAPLTRYISYRWVYFITMSLYGLFCLICGFATNLDLLLVGRIGMGITASSAIPLGLMLIGEFFDKERETSDHGVRRKQTFDPCATISLKPMIYFHRQLIEK